MTDLASPTPSSNYFEKPEIEIEDNEVLLFCCLKNEEKRLPYFMKYYRSLGIKKFFIIDNASTDKSSDFLKLQNDVHYFHTSMSYKGSSAGRLWLQELAEFYGENRWCLTADVDELLVYPGAEFCNIPTLCKYLEVEDSDGLFCTFLDLYSDRPLSEAVYMPGEPFTNICNNFDADSYVVRPGSLPPFLGVFGGPRGESFIKEGRQGPMMKKVPLVKYTKGFSYIYSTHSHKYTRLSKITGALLHFKFFDFFAELAAYEAKRGDRRQQNDYKHYADHLNESTQFFTSKSFKFTKPSDLVQLGILASNRDYRNFCMNLVDPSNPAMETIVHKAFPQVLPDPPLHSSKAPTIRWINFLWPFANNRLAINHFIDGSTGGEFTNRKRFIDSARSKTVIHDIIDDQILVYIPEEIVYKYNSPKLSLAITKSNKLLQSISLNFQSPSISIDQGSLVPGIYRIKIEDILGSEETDNRIYGLGVHLVADEHIDEIKATQSDVNTPFNVASHFALAQPIAELDFFSSESTPDQLPMMINAGDDDAQIVDGVIERASEGEIHGWLKAPEKIVGEDILPRDISIYINDRYCGSTKADIETDKDFLRFCFALPLGYFYERGEKELSVAVRIARHNLTLRRSPLKMSGGENYVWNKEEERWA